jgi:hypothetical protein
MIKKLPTNEDDFVELIRKIAERSRDTSGHRKLVQYFERIIIGDYFQTKLKEIRNRYKIPHKGFSEKDFEHYPIYPKEWIFRKDLQTIKDIEKEIKSICKRFHLHYMDWREPVDELIFYNKYTLEYSLPNSFNLCIVRGPSEDFGKSFKESDDNAYPIEIRISPYAGIRDILDFIKKHSLLIKSYQRTYIDKTVKIGKERRKKSKVQVRNAFIYKNRNLPSKKIMSLITDKFGGESTIDYAYIGKIISLEKQKRKEL